MDSRNEGHNGTSGRIRMEKQMWKNECATTDIGIIDAGMA